MEDIERAGQPSELGRHYSIHTDGGCRGNPGPGAWAAIMQLKDGETVLKEHEISGWKRQTTNIQMEMTAPARAIAMLKERETPVILYSDSKLVIDGMTQWVDGWRAKGWHRGKNGPVANRELWEALLAASEGRQVGWRWVKGHAGNHLNERADLAVNLAMDRMP